MAGACDQTTKKAMDENDIQIVEAPKNCSWIILDRSLDEEYSDLLILPVENLLKNIVTRIIITPLIDGILRETARRNAYFFLENISTYPDRSINIS